MAAIIDVQIQPSVQTTINAIQTAINTLRAGPDTNISLLYDKSDTVKVVGTAGPQPHPNTVTCIGIVDNDFLQPLFPDLLSRVNPLDAAQQIITDKLRTRFGYYICLAQNFGYFPGGIYTPFEQLVGSESFIVPASPADFDFTADFVGKLPPIPYTALLMNVQISIQVSSSAWVPLAISSVEHINAPLVPGPYLVRQHLDGMFLPGVTSDGGATFAPGANAWFWTVMPAIDNGSVHIVVNWLPTIITTAATVTIRTIGFW
jgi:hypothetical protein